MIRGIGMAAVVAIHCLHCLSPLLLPPISCLPQNSLSLSLPYSFSAYASNPEYQQRLKDLQHEMGMGLWTVKPKTEEHVKFLNGELVIPASAAPMSEIDSKNAKLYDLLTYVRCGFARRNARRKEEMKRTIGRNVEKRCCYTRPFDHFSATNFLK